jgi:hypothetical protein
MKKILSISIGSPTRDHTTQVNFLGEDIEISRQGTNGDMNKAIELHKKLDGKVDAFGIGGSEFYLGVGEKKYYFRQVKAIRKAIKLSKAGDGNGIKGILAARAFSILEEHLQKEGRTLNRMNGLKTTAVDRYQMAEAMVNAGIDTIFADFYFNLGIPIKLRSLKSVRVMAAILLPFITQMPFEWFYPLGANQELPPVNKYPHLYENADIIGGDFLQIREFLPPKLNNKIIVTNTTTEKNVELLKERGLNILVTTTPRLEGRSFGTNVMEATLRSLIDKPDSKITKEDFIKVIYEIPLLPTIEVLNPYVKQNEK